MNGQLDFMARLADPDTSSEAAREDRGGLELVVLSHVRAAGFAGATAGDVAEAMHGQVQQNSVARRLTSLRRAGLVEDVGKRPGPSGRNQRVYRSVGHLKGLAS